jgi:hypothetical protein
MFPCKFKDISQTSSSTSTTTATAPSQLPTPPHRRSYTKTSTVLKSQSSDALIDESEAHAETNEELTEQHFDPEHVTALSALQILLFRLLAGGSFMHVLLNSSSASSLTPGRFLQNPTLPKQPLLAALSLQSARHFLRNDSIIV